VTSQRGRNKGQERKNGPKTKERDKEWTRESGMEKQWRESGQMSTGSEEEIA
jgi:hypothetical protein